MSEFAKQVSPVALESEMRESYLAYAMSVKSVACQMSETDLNPFIDGFFMR